MFFKIIYFLQFCFVVMASASARATNTSSTEDFFPEIKGNLTKLTWAHAVNNLTLLGEALNNDDIMMLEADIVLGYLNGTPPIIPIMGHPPINTSDLSLEQFLNSVNNFNNNQRSGRKGVKLDFKTIEVFKASLEILTNMTAKANFPIWINADILPGPVNATTLPVNATEFLKEAKHFPNSVLSIGWTTSFPVTAYNVSYTDDQITNMINTIKANNVTAEITFPVRAVLAAESLPQMQRLLSEIPNSTLTIWLSSLPETYRVNVEHLRKLISTIGVDKIYIDVPKEFFDGLHLNELNKTIDALAAKDTAFTMGVSHALLAIAVLYCIINTIINSALCQ